MDKVAETSILYDLYGGLLTEKKRNVMELYHEEDLSLSEIAEEEGISRAAVHDALKSAEKNLRGYEEKLGLAKAYLERQEVLKDIRDDLKTIKALSKNQKESEKDFEKTIVEIEKLLTKLED